jgi:transposase
MAFYGIDLHSNSFVVARLSPEESPDPGTISITKHYLDETSFQQFKDILRLDDYVIIESSTNSFWFYDQIQGLVKKCFVLDVNKYRVGSKKTDKVDAKKLVKKLAFYVLSHGDEDDLPTVFVPPLEIRELRALFSTYRLNRKTITQFKNRIHSIVKQNGICISRRDISTPSFQNKLLQLPLRNVWLFQIKTLAQQITLLEEQTNELKKVIYELGYQLFPKEIELLLSIKGFSPLTAIALMSDVIDVDRFPCVKKFCAYLRTAPKVKSSNEHTRIGSTNRNSRSLSCTLLSQSVEHFAKSGDYLSDFYERIKVGKRPGVYRMAMIRKILVCAYYMLKRSQRFHWVDEKLYQAKLKEFQKAVGSASRLVA